MKTATEKKTPEHPLPNGHAIRFRREQQILWGAIAGLLGTGVVAGLYWLAFQKKYGHIGSTVISAKNWWDGGVGFIDSGRWAAYRHGVLYKDESAEAALVGVLVL